MFHSAQALLEQVFKSFLEMKSTKIPALIEQVQSGTTHAHYMYKLPIINH